MLVLFVDEGLGGLVLGRCGRGVLLLEERGRRLLLQSPGDGKSASLSQPVVPLLLRLTVTRCPPTADVRDVRPPVVLGEVLGFQEQTILLHQRALISRLLLESLDHRELLPLGDKLVVSPLPHLAVTSRRSAALLLADLAEADRSIPGPG